MNTTDEQNTPWQVDFTRKARKQVEKLPDLVRASVYLLKAEMEREGPVQPEWHHYSKLVGKKREYHHCHLNKGHPRYVAVWLVEDRKMQVIEICYADTHENVNYSQFK